MPLKIIVDTKKQEATLMDGDREICRYPVSTALKGLGCEEGSYKTPTGSFKIAQKIGEGAAPGAVFRGRVATGEIWSAHEPQKNSSDDLILTRILWLEGLDAANANTFQRYIYFHGTNQEDLLGTPTSHGCIRLSNKDVMDLFDRVPVGTLVTID